MHARIEMKPLSDERIKKSARMLSLLQRYYFKSGLSQISRRRKPARPRADHRRSFRLSHAFLF
jgi:hypothetical protein